MVRETRCAGKDTASVSTCEGTRFRHRVEDLRVCLAVHGEVVDGFVAALVGRVICVGCFGEHFVDCSCVRQCQLVSLSGQLSSRLGQVSSVMSSG